MKLRMKRRLRLGVLVVTAGMALPVSAEKPEPAKDAAVWLDFDGSTPGLEAVGSAEVGIALDGAAATRSQRAGGDGKVVRFSGGYLELDSESLESWNGSGESATLYLRMRPEDKILVPSGLFSVRGEDHAAINLSVISLNRVDTFLNLLTAFPRLPRSAPPKDGPAAANRKGTFINAPVEKIPAQEWYDLVITRDGMDTQLFVNGRLLAFRNLGGSYALAAHWFPPSMPAKGVSLGADLDGSRPFHGSMDHLALWNRALSDEEVRSLMGGRLDTSARAKLADPGDVYADGELYLSDAFGEPGRLNATNRSLKKAFEEVREHSETFPLIHPTLPGDTYDVRGVRYGEGYHLFPAIFLGWWHTVRVPAMPYWGHLYSPDLVKWHPMPCPNVPVYNSNGSVVVQGDEAVVLGGWKVPLGSQEGPGLKIARSNDPLLRAWRNDLRNPVRTPVPESIGVPEEGLRDTDAWFDEATGLWNVIATVPYGYRYREAAKHHLFRSENLEEFDYVGPFHEAGKGEAGHEVPHVFVLEDKVVFSSLRPLREEPLENYQVGTVGEDGRFVREAGGFWDHGIAGGHPHEFIGYVYRPDGGVVLWQAIRGYHTLMRQRGIKELMADGWSVAYSLPREVRLRDDRTLAFAPIEELKQLRGEKTPSEEIRGGALELDCELEVRSEEDVILEIGDETESLRLRYSPVEGRLFSERGTAKIHAVDASAPLTPGEDGRLRLHVFVDRGIVEVFFGDGEVMTNRFLPVATDDLGFSWNLPEGAKLVRDEAWSLDTIWGEFLE